MYVNHARYEQNSEGGYDVFYKGWNYSEWKPQIDWKKIAVVADEAAAKIKCADLLPSTED